MNLKEIRFPIEIKSVNHARSYILQKAYTNDLNSIKIIFELLDCTPADLSGATASILLYMRDGSFFQDEATITDNTVTYILTESQGNHAGVAQAQVIVKKTGTEWASSKEKFEIVSGLETVVATEVMIKDWTTLTAEARAFIDDAEVAEDLRVSAEDSRVTAEQGRVTAETGRATAELARVTAEQGRAAALAEIASGEGIGEGAISLGQTNFAVSSTNLANPNNRDVGYSISSGDGSIIANAAYDVSVFIKIKPSTVYTGVGIVRKAFYTEGKAFITSDTVAGTFTSPANATYIKIVASPQNWGSIVQLNESSTLLPYEPYSTLIPLSLIKVEELDTRHIKDRGIELGDTVFGSQSTNLLNKRLITKNKVIGVDGLITDTGAYSISEYFRVKPNTPYTYKNVQRVAFYDIDKNFLGYTSLSAYDTIRTETSWINAKVYYARVNVYPSREDSGQVNEGLELLPYEIGGEHLGRAYFPPHSVGLEELDNISVRDFHTDEDVSLDYSTGKIKRAGGDRIVLDTDFNKVFTANVVIPDKLSETSSGLSDDLYALYDDLMAQYPEYITKTLLGYESSPSKKPIYRYDFKPAEPNSNFPTRQIKYLVTSGTHPEVTAAWTTYHVFENIALNWQQDELLEALRFNIHFIVIPVMAPWAYDNRSRVNYNGVDMARNFPAGWMSGTNLGDSTYGGVEPLTEIESQVVYQIMIDNPDLVAVIDFHNFSQPSDGYYFLWGAPANTLTRNITRAHYRSMDRKWKKEYPFINQNYDVFIGDINGSAPGGSLGAQADHFGVRLAITYEMGPKLFADADGTPSDSNTMTMGYEAFVNFLIKATHEMTRVY